MDTYDLYIFSKIPGNYGFTDVQFSIKTHPVDRYKLLIDHEAEEFNIPLKELVSYYPGVKTVGIVSNPWFRMLEIFNNLNKYKNVLGENLLKKVNLNSFQEFIMEFDPIDKLSDQYWYSFGTNQIEWLTYIDENNNIKDVDYLLKAETLEVDFSEFVKNSTLSNNLKLHLSTSYQDYTLLYNEDMKNKIQKIFYKDIDYFKYSFS